MENSNHIRHIDELGRVVIPANFRKALGLETDSPVSINLQGNTITIQAATSRCAICGKEDNLHIIGDKWICQSCVDFINHKFAK